MGRLSGFERAQAYAYLCCTAYGLTKTPSVVRKVTSPVLMRVFTEPEESLMVASMVHVEVIGDSVAILLSLPTTVNLGL